MIKRCQRIASFFLSALSAADFLIWGNGLTENTAFPTAKHRKLKLKRRNELDRLVRAVVTGFGVGYLPLAPGTWGSLEAVLLVWVVHWLLPAHEMMVLASLLVVLTLPAIFLSARFSRSESDPDPSEIVIDEILGQILCLLWVPVSIVSLVVGFSMFRFFDIVKPFPARRSEKLPGGIGIVCDDLIAGLYAGLSLKILALLVSIE